MPSDIYWIENSSDLQLAIAARPRAGDWLEDEISHWQRSGVGVVLSLLEREEIDELGLGREGALCARSGIEYVSFPIPDRGVPSDVTSVMTLAEEIASKGKPIVVHCRAGIGRSSVIAAAVLVGVGIGPDEALSAIAEARGMSVPDTDAQRDWVLKLQRPEPARL